MFGLSDVELSTGPEERSALMKKQYKGKHMAATIWCVVGMIVCLLCFTACGSGSTVPTLLPYTTPTTVDQQHVMAHYQMALQKLIAQYGLLTSRPGSAVR